MIRTKVVMTPQELRVRLNLHQNYHLGTGERRTNEGVWCFEPSGNWRLWADSYALAVKAEAR